MSDNPLSKYFRKPAMYVTLPTNGIFNPEIDKTILDEVPVMPMTALDEIALRNPDALLNGEALISVIKSCVPSIPDPRKLCNIDAESLFLAIQYASTGKDMEYTHTCSECQSVTDYKVDLNLLMNRFPEITEIPIVEYEDVKIYISPATVESMTRLSLMDIEQQKIVNDIRNTVSEDPEDVEEDLELTKRFYASYIKLAKHNVDLLAETIFKIETPEGVVTDKTHILEFINNIPAKTIDEINEIAVKMSKKPENANKFSFTCPECEHVDEVEVEVNPVNFSIAG